MPHHRSQRGSVLLLVSIVLLFFISASVPLAQAQVMHARRLMADYAKMQAVYAAEAGVYAVFDTRQDFTNVPLITSAASRVSYSAKLQPSSWIESTGSAVIQSDSYQAVARAYVSGNQILMWDLTRL